MTTRRIATVLSSGFTALMAIQPASSEPADFSWSGLYGGGNVGRAWVDLATTNSVLETDGTVFGIQPVSVASYPGDDSSSSFDGWFGGGQIGLNLSAGNVVVGLEADIQAGDQSASSQFLGSEFGPTYRTSASLDLFATARLRAGYVIDDVLIYGTAGVAMGRGSGTLSITPGTPQAPGAGGPFKGKDSRTHTGYAIGGGIEYRLTSSLSVKAEYLHIDLGRESYTFPLADSNGAVVTADEALKLDVGRLGLNVHF